MSNGTTKRVRITITIDADIDPLEVQSRALGRMYDSAISEVPPPNQITSEQIDSLARQTAGTLQASLEFLVFAAHPWRTVEQAVPSMAVVPFTGVGVRVEIDP